MEVAVCADAPELGRRASRRGAALMREALSARGRARVVFATGTSQIETLGALVAEPDLDWRQSCQPMLPAIPD